MGIAEDIAAATRKSLEEQLKAPARQSGIGSLLGGLLGGKKTDEVVVARPTGQRQESIVAARPNAAEALQSKISEWKTALAGATLPAGATEALKQFRVKPTADEIAKLVESGKLDGGLAQKMINANLVQLPDPKTIGKQSPAPVETRDVGGIKAQAVAVAAGPTSTPTSAAPPVATTTTPSVLPQSASPPTVSAAAPVSNSPASTVSTAPAVTTAVTPVAAFSAAADPAVAATKPSATSALDAAIERANQSADSGRLETLMRARAQVAKLGEPAP